MSPQNQFLSEFLEIRTADNESDRVWRAMRPRDARALSDGSVEIDVPFEPFESAIPTEEKIIPLRVSAYGERVLRISTGEAKAAAHLIQWDESLKSVPLRVVKSADVWRILDESGTCRMALRMEDEPVIQWSNLIASPPQVFEATILPDGRHPVSIAARDCFTPISGHLGSLGLGFVEPAAKPADLRWTWSLEADSSERFCGTGERFRRLDLSGGTYDLVNADALGVNGRRAYKNVPFYLSSRGYGLLALTSAHCRFSLADVSSRAACGLVKEPVLDLILFGGSPERILFDYRRITGFPAQPPLWSYGVWMAKMTYFSADEVREVAQRLRSERFPCDVLHLDTGWFATDWKCEWEFSQQRFPDPEAFFSEMLANGFRVSLWQLPNIAKGTKHWDVASKGKFIAPKTATNTTGSNFGNSTKESGTIDFTNEAAIQWYKGLLARLLKMGAAAIKTDFGETIDLDADYQGVPPLLLQNLYALLYQKAAFEVTQEIKGDSIIWARAGWIGCQRYPVHWGGDCAASWDGMSGSLRGGLHLGLSGYGFWAHDVPGFHGVPDFMNSRPSDELYVRWTQFGVFSSHLRYHGTSSREPYEYPAVADLVRYWWTIRYALIPYLLDEASKTSLTGMPLLQAMMLQFPDDPICWQVDDQFFCGDSLLVAPVLIPGGIRDVYLPDGEWIDFWSGQCFQGGRWLKKVESPLDRIPVFARSGASIRLYPACVQHTGEMDLTRATRVILDGSWSGEEFFSRILSGTFK